MLSNIFPGCSCKECGGGEAAVEAVVKRRIPFDIILMDLYMPGMDGYEAVRVIRQMELDLRTGIRVPIFAVTAHAGAEDRERCLREGMDAYLMKPVTKPTLLRTVNSFIGSPPVVHKNNSPSADLISHQDRYESSVDSPHSASAHSCIASRPLLSTSPAVLNNILATDSGVILT
jgi:CheY-like chemotaxis protein